jgi:hypothetical protein
MSWYDESHRHACSARGVRTRRDIDPNKQLKNLQMNDAVYKLRREAIKYIYEAKELCELPRITVRITENYNRIMGRALLKDNVIWIPKRSIEDKHDLRAIVYHEILHAVWAVPHNKNCPLMSPYLQNLSKQQADKLFIKYAKKYGGKCR